MDVERIKEWWEQHKTLAILAAGILVLGAVIVWQQLQARPQQLAVTDSKPAESTEAESELVVDVEGAVAVPGVRRLPAGSLVEDALTAAGGLTENADAIKAAKDLNRADKLKNGQKVFVPLLGELTAANGPGGTAKSGGGGEASGGVINLNSASQAELEELPGVGPSTAKKIIEHREANGPFAAIEGLMDVSGIGEATFEKLKEKITV